MNTSTASTAPTAARGTALVTGASVGIGEAIVRRLVADGWRVIAAARRVDKLEALATELGAAVLPLALDVTDHAAVAALPAALPADWAAVDLLVNNAGLALGREPAHQANLADWQTMIDANVSGLMHCTHAFLPGMVARGRGHIVNLGSVAGELPYPGGNVYGASKAFVHQFTMGLKADLIATPVRCTSIEPGLVAGSEFSSVRFKGDAERAASIYEGTTPLMPGDIAEAVSWVVALPAHVNINVLQMMPVCQGPGAVGLFRKAAPGG